MYLWRAVMRLVRYLSGLVPETHNLGLILRKALDKLQLRSILQNTWPVLLNDAKAMKNKEVWETVTARVA